MKITTWNVNGLRAREGQVIEWLLKEKPDVLCLQEIKATVSQVPEALTAIGDYNCFWHGGEGGYSGVALCVRKSFTPVHPKFGHPPFDVEARMVTCILGPLEVASIYVPNGGKDLSAKIKFLTAMGAYAREAKSAGRELLWCGDLNVALEPRDVHPKLNNPSQTGQTDFERELLRDILSHGFSDVLRNSHPTDDALFTWWAPWRQHKERNIGWRLDYVLATAQIAARAKACVVDRLFGTSDHGPVTAVFEDPLFKPEEVNESGRQHAQTSEAVSTAGVSQLDLFGR
jgi:exodeoxyribonuclease-3